jgi:hypothetical protein
VFKTVARRNIPKEEGNALIIDQVPLSNEAAADV